METDVTPMAFNIPAGNFPCEFFGVGQPDNGQCPSAFFGNIPSGFRINEF
jgi:hypothetical protein